MNQTPIIKIDSILLLRKRRQMRWGRISFFAIASLIFFMTGCTIFADYDQPAIESGPGVVLTSQNSIGQTFVARHGGLSGVEVYLSPSPDAFGAVVLHLRESPLSSIDILTSTIFISKNFKSEPYLFSFRPILFSHSRYYYFFLEFRGDGHIQIPTASWRAYADGSLYVNHSVHQAQLAFSLKYYLPFIILDLALMFLYSLFYAFFVLLILLFAGYWVIRRQGEVLNGDFTIVLIQSSVSFLALWMILLVWLSVLNVRLDRQSVIALVAASVFFGFVLWIRDRPRWWRSTFWLGHSWPETIAFWGIILLSVWLRLFVARGAVMLPGSDTYHHTLIVQMFEEQGGIPRSYEPYAPLISFSYHFGFHSIVALFRWLFGTELLTTTKTTAAVLNGAIAATAGLMSERVWGSRRAAVVTAAVVGIIAASPFALLRWGRFTQTAGLFFVGAAISYIWRLKRGQRILAVFLIAGTLLSHYRIYVFLLIFLLIFAALLLLNRRKDEAAYLVITVSVSMLLVAPWLVRLAWVQLDPYGLRLKYSLLPGFNSLSRLEDVISFPTNVIVVFFALISFLISLFVGRFRASAIAIAMWIVVGIAAAREAAWDLKTAVLSSYVPVAVLIGPLFALAWDWRWRGWVRGLIVSLLMVLGLIGVRSLPDLVYSGRYYLRQSDMYMMEWIRENVPADAIFMVDAVVFEWSPGWFVGIDAGYWVPLLTRRASILPPMNYPLEWSDPQQISKNIQLMARTLLRESGGHNLSPTDVTHIILTRDHGLLGSIIPDYRQNLKLVYRYDRGAIFLYQDGNLSNLMAFFR